MAKRSRSATRSVKGQFDLTTNPRKRLATEKQTDSIRDSFPSGLASPALRALFAAGLTQLGDLADVTESELAALHGMGPKAVTTLKDALAAEGMNFRPE